MIELKAIINDIDYTETFDQFLPNLIDHYKNGSEQINNPVIKAICDHPESASFIINTALSFMSQESKEALMCKLISANQQKIINSLNAVCKSHGIELTITDLDVQSK